MRCIMDMARIMNQTENGNQSKRIASGTSAKSEKLTIKIPHGLVCGDIHVPFHTRLHIQYAESKAITMTAFLCTT
jgi:hypothetical protein